MRKILSLIAAAAILLSLASCAGVSSDSEITVMGKKSDLEKSYMISIFEKYEKTTGKKLKIIAYEDSEYETRAAEAFANGTGPDIFMHFNNADLNKFDVENNFVYLNNEKWVDDLTYNAKAYCEDDNGNILGLPFWECSVSGCYYNKTLLDSLGLKPAATQAEFDTLCQALADIGYTPICWPANGCSWMVQFALDPIFADNPENLEKINKNEISYSDIPEVLSMAEWISSAAEKGWFGSGYFNIGWDEISPIMASGDAAMTFIWDTWFYTDFVPGKYSIDDFALMPVFLNTERDGTYEGGNLNMMMVNRNGDKLDEALDFLSFCASSENYNAAFDGISTVSCFRGQTTNIQSKMIVDAKSSIKAHERVSTAASRIIGYSANDVANAINDMLHKKIDAAGCVKLMDEKRIAEAKKEGVEGF